MAISMLGSQPWCFCASTCFVAAVVVSATTVVTIKKGHVSLITYV